MIFQMFSRASSKTLRVSEADTCTAGYTDTHTAAAQAGNSPSNLRGLGLDHETFACVCCAENIQPTQLHQQRMRGKKGAEASMSAHAIHHCSRAGVKQGAISHADRASSSEHDMLTPRSANV